MKSVVYKPDAYDFFYRFSCCDDLVIGIANGKRGSKAALWRDVIAHLVPKEHVDVSVSCFGHKAIDGREVVLLY